MQVRTKLAILVVLGCAFAPIGLAWMTVRQEGPPSMASNPGKPSEDHVTVLVARKPIPQGTFMMRPEEWFEAQSLPRCGVPERAVTKFDQLQDHVLAKNIAKGEPVDSANLLEKQMNGPSMNILKGFRAVTIKVSHSDCLAFQRGSRVCVENTVRTDSTGEAYKQIILENILILATDPVDDSEPREGSGPWSDTVTLAVTPEDSQVLAFASQMGTLRLLAPAAK
jgi:Flp pilus assembly protein CpaB